MAQVAVCSQINTKHINTVWAERTFLECKTVGSSRNRKDLKGQYSYHDMKCFFINARPGTTTIIETINRTYIHNSTLVLIFMSHLD